MEIANESTELRRHPGMDYLFAFECMRDESIGTMSLTRLGY